MNKIKYYGAQNRKKRVQKSFEGTTSKTDQSFGIEADIKNIMARYQKTGVLVDRNSTFIQPQFGDFAQIPNFQEVRNLMIEADEQFLELPSRVRERFKNNVEDLIAFLKDDNNRQEAEELGLIEKRPPEAPQEPQKESKKTSENTEKK